MIRVIVEDEFPAHDELTWLAQPQQLAFRAVVAGNVGNWLSTCRRRLHRSGGAGRPRAVVPDGAVHEVLTVRTNTLHVPGFSGVPWNLGLDAVASAAFRSV